MTENRRNPGYIKITGVGDKTKKEIEAIARNLNSNVSALMKPKIREIINSYPEHMRIMPPEY